MEVRHFADAAAFDAETRAYLLADEAMHCLPLGIIATLAAEPGRFAHAPYLATVEEDGELVAVALRTPPRGLVLSRARALDTLDRLAADASRAQPDLPGVIGPTREAAAFAEAWRRRTGRAVRRGMAERVYRLERVSPVVGAPGELRRATTDDRALVVRYYDAFVAEALPGEDPSTAARSVDARLGSRTSGLYLWWDGGRAVSLAGYGGPTPNGIRIGPVYTPPELRGRGYASACVAALSRRLLEGNRRSCFLFTDLANPTSNRIYRNIGYRPVGDVDEWLFAPESP